MRQMPRHGRFDSSLALLRQGYLFIDNGCRATGSDIFETRLLLRRTICMRGAEAARVFYDNERFARRGAMPSPVRRTLLGTGGVQGLDGEAHRARKAAFMSLMTESRLRDLAALTGDRWQASIRKWAAMPRVALFEEVQELLCRAVCAWSGVPLGDAEAARRARDLGAMIDGAGSIGLRHLRGRRARKRGERWIAALVQAVRRGSLRVPADGSLHVFATHVEAGGRHLDAHTAAVEILNVLRPTVAIARFVVFSALALHRHPACRVRVADDARYAGWFIQEVRRFYPFFPMVAARVRRGFEWRGYRFPEGRRVMLDLYGTNRLPALWSQPDAFRPERFRDWSGSPFDFIPQGGGNHYLHHRCAGEWLTIELMRVALDALTRRMTYRVPAQDLAVDLSRMPTLPGSRFVIENVRPVE